MIKYISKRILIFIPTLFLLTVFTFLLSKKPKEDPIDEMINQNDDKSSFLINPLKKRQEYKHLASNYYLDRPKFYFSIQPISVPDTLYKIFRKRERETIKKLAIEIDDWGGIQVYYKEILSFENDLWQNRNQIDNKDYNTLNIALQYLFKTHNREDIYYNLNVIKSVILDDSNPILKERYIRLKNSVDNINIKRSNFNRYIPKLVWHGLDNQYHHWIADFITNKNNISLIDGRSISSKLKPALFWTILISIISIFLVFAISIPLGVIMAANKEKRWTQFVSKFLFAIYSMPVFWIATVLVILFTTDEYGNWAKIFASIGLGDIPSDSGFWEKISISFPHLILPIAMLVYPSLAYVTSQMFDSAKKILKKDFIKFARINGINHAQILWKYALPNAMFPIITIMAGIFPALISGSLIVEIIFNIPGMGRLGYSAILSSDWPMILAIIIISALMTMIGILFSDIMYYFLDPRIKLNNERKY